MTTEIPQMALSIRQPWLWAIMHAGKDVENRNWHTGFRGPVCLHASKGMTKGEFDRFVDLARAMNRQGSWPQGVWVPFQSELPRGAIVATARITDCITSSASPWFAGPYGFVLRDVRPVEHIPAVGALGFFKWRK